MIWLDATSTAKALATFIRAEERRRRNYFRDDLLAAVAEECTGEGCSTDENSREFFGWHMRLLESGTLSAALSGWACRRATAGAAQSSSGLLSGRLQARCAKE